MSKNIKDMTTGSLWDKIFFFALPLAATGILQQLFNAADIAVVGNFTGEKSELCMAAVGANTPLIGFIVNSVIAISLGANVIIATAVGMKNKALVSKTAVSSIIFSVLLGISISIIGIILSPYILKSQNIPDEVLPLASSYFCIYMAGLPVIFLYNFESAVLRGVGDTKTPLAVLSISGVINVLLNLFFVLIIKLNVEGVALATVISNTISAAILFFILLKRKEIFGISKSNLSIDVATLSKVLKIGIPAGIQSMAFSSANIIIQSSINTLGTIIMAASSAAFNLEIFAYCVLNSFSQACTTFVGQNNGAGNKKRCRKVLALCLAEDALCSAASILIILFLGKYFLRIFNSNPDVIKIGYTRLVIIFIAYAFSFIYEIMAGYMRGFSISIMPAFLTIIGICGVRIAWIYGVFPKSPTFQTIMLAYPLSFIATDLLVGSALLIVRPSRRQGNL